MSAMAAASWSRVQRRTDRSRSSPSRPPSADPAARSESTTSVSAVQIARLRWRPPRPNEPQTDDELGRDIHVHSLVHLDEIAKGHWELVVFGGAEWVHPEQVLEACDDDRERQRIKSRLHQRSIVGERRQLVTLLGGYLLELRDDRVSNGHGHGSALVMVKVVCAGYPVGEEQSGRTMQRV